MWIIRDVLGAWCMTPPKRREKVMPQWWTPSSSFNNFHVKEIMLEWELIIGNHPWRCSHIEMDSSYGGRCFSKSRCFGRSGFPVTKECGWGENNRRTYNHGCKWRKFATLWSRLRCYAAECKGWDRSYRSGICRRGKFLLSLEEARGVSVHSNVREGVYGDVNSNMGVVRGGNTQSSE